MTRFNPDRRRDRFIGPYGRGFGILWTKTSHRLRTYVIIGLALLACWVVLVPGYVWVVEPSHSVSAAIRWAAATLFDLVGLHDWRWTLDTDVGQQRWRSYTIRFDDWHLAHVKIITASLHTGLLVATGICTVLGLLALALLVKVDRDVSGRRILRGRGLISDKKLARALRKKGIASELMIGKVPLIRHAETYNTLLLGAQGTGKTSVTETFLEGIRKRGEPAVVYDYGPGLLQRFYDADRGDIILNPLDQRSADWSPWSEIRKASDCTAIAEAFIPKGIERDPFWGNAGRLLYAEVLDRLRDDPDRSIERLLHILLRMSQEEVRQDGVLLQAKQHGQGRLLRLGAGRRVQAGDQGAGQDRRCRQLEQVLANIRYGCVAGDRGIVVLFRDEPDGQGLILLGPIPRRDRIPC